MSLLREIQAAAIDGTSDLETLLRKCRVLASRLQNGEFKQWVQSELDGYRDEIEVPEYRQICCQAYGLFVGPFGGGWSNLQIPVSCIPEKFREDLTTLRMREGVSALTTLARESESDTIHCNWPADVFPLFEGKVYENMRLAQAWQALPKSYVIGILSTVRNRILDFALEIEATNPEAGEATPDAKPIPEERVSQIFNHCIFGSVGGSVASGYHVSQTTQQNIKSADFESLAALLKEVGLAEGDIVELKEAITVETNPTKEGFGPRVTGWISKAVGKVAQGGMKISTSVATNILTDAIKSYYGL